jgi:predicted small integral membrane protein
MWLRSSDIIAPEMAREVSGRTERTPGESLESSRLAARFVKLACLGLVADAA